MFLTISIDVCGAGISLAITVGVDLSGVVLIWAVITAITNKIFIVVKLPGIIQQRTVVLGHRRNKYKLSVNK